MLVSSLAPGSVMVALPVGKCTSGYVRVSLLVGMLAREDHAVPMWTTGANGWFFIRRATFGRRTFVNQITGGGSTVRRMQLGSRLRALRRAAGLTREEAAHPIRASESKISRMELGRVGFKERDIADLLTLYGVKDPDQRHALMTFARDANTPSWWHPWGDVLDPWFQSYLDFEQAAELIRTYEIQFVPGLLQTEAYARAVISLG